MAEQSTKIKKKVWYQISAPKQFEYTIIGETPVYDPSEMMGKTLSHSLMNLLNDPKKQNVSINFKVTQVDGNKAMTQIIGFKIANSSLKRFVRRNSEKIDLSFSCETSDNVTIRVKPLLIFLFFIIYSICAS